MFLFLVKILDSENIKKGADICGPIHYNSLEKKKMTKIRVKVIAAQEVKECVDKDLQKEDPKDAREIIRLCGQNIGNSGEEC